MDSEIITNATSATWVGGVSTSVRVGMITAPKVVVILYVPDNITITVPKTLAFFASIMLKRPRVLWEVCLNRLILPFR